MSLHPSRFSMSVVHPVQRCESFAGLIVFSTPSAIPDSARRLPDGVLRRRPDRRSILRLALIRKRPSLLSPLMDERCDAGRTERCTFAGLASHASSSPIQHPGPSPLGCPCRAQPSGARAGHRRSLYGPRRRQVGGGQLGDRACPCVLRSRPEPRGAPGVPGVRREPRCLRRRAGCRRPRPRSATPTRLARCADG